MPSYANLQQFMALVRTANPHYERIERSSLHNIVAGLQQPIPNKQAIQALVVGLPPQKKQKYQQALAFLDRDYLHPPGVVGGVRVMALGPVVPPRPLHVVTPQQRALAGGGQAIVGGTVHDANGPFHGWTEVDNLNRIPGGPNEPRTSAFTPLQIAHLTHLLRAVQQAIDLSLQMLRSTPTLPGDGLPPRPAPPRVLGGPPTAPPVIDMKSRAFVQFFGPCKRDRLKTVTENYAEMQRQLFGARGSNATGLAVVNQSATNSDMAATYRRSIYRPASGQILLIAGRGLFKTAIGQVFKANDNTIGTLIHEFGHACVDASDIPRPVHLQAGQGLDERGMPANGTGPCVNGEHDRQLVAWIFGQPWVGGGTEPHAPTNLQRVLYEDYPLQNADAYGQYALERLVDHLTAKAA